MPNSRKKTKKYLSAWVPQELRAQLEALAKRTGKPLSSLVEEILRQEVEKHDRKDAP